MNWFARKSLVFTLAAVIATAALIGGGIGLSYYAALNEARRTVDSAARQTAERVYTVFWQAEGVLAAMAYLARQGCSRDLVMAMRGVIAGNASLHNMVYLTPNGRIGCTALGVIDPPVAVDDVALLRPPGSLVSFTPPVETLFTPGRSIIARHNLRNGGALEALFAPSVLVAPIETSALRNVARGSVTMAGTVLTTFGGEGGGGNGFIGSTAEVGLFDTTVSVAVPSGYCFRDWERGAVLLGGVGLMVMAGVTAYAWQWSGRQSPLRADLDDALRYNQFEVHYQPVIDLATDRCIGAEALLRWHHPVRGLVRPDEFIPVAEDTGQIIPITRWLLRRVCEQVGDLLRADANFHVTVNLSPPHFKTLEVVADAKQTLAECNVSPSQVLFEITERGLVDDIGCRAVIEAFSEIGCEVAVDDFGTGYSSLAYIQNFRLDHLKIDQAFVKAIGTGAATAGLADVIIDMAKALGLRIIAEGVETQAHVDFLKARKVESAQGWYYSKPLDVDTFREFVTDFNRSHDKSKPPRRLRRVGGTA